MIGVQDQQQVDDARDHRIGDVLLARRGEHHVHEVGGVIQFVLGEHERLADRMLVGIGGDGGDLRDQAHDGIVDVAVVLGLLVERRQRSHGRRAHRHGMRVLGQRLEEPVEVLVQQRVQRHLALERGEHRA